MADFDSGLPPINPPDIMRMEYRQVVGGNLLDKPTFGEKLKSFFAKMGTFITGIAGKILPFFGPFGMVGSAAAYGLQKFTQSKLDQWEAKKQYNASLDDQAAAISNQPLYAPGFGDVASSGFSDPSIQVAPFARGYEQGIENTLNNKGQAAVNAVNGMQAGTTL